MERSEHRILEEAPGIGNLERICGNETGTTFDETCSRRVVSNQRKHDGGEGRKSGMKLWTSKAGLALAMILSGAASSAAQTTDALRQWDQSVDLLIRKVAPSVVQI
jgi:hypothetical protein